MSTTPPLLVAARCQRDRTSLHVSRVPKPTRDPAWTPEILEVLLRPTASISSTRRSSACKRSPQLAIPSRGHLELGIRPPHAAPVAADDNLGLLPNHDCRYARSVSRPTYKCPRYEYNEPRSLFTPRTGLDLGSRRGPALDQVQPAQGSLQLGTPSSTFFVHTFVPPVNGHGVRCRGIRDFHLIPAALSVTISQQRKAFLARRLVTRESSASLSLPPLWKLLHRWRLCTAP